jgi:hypothetical protein
LGSTLGYRYDGNARQFETHSVYYAIIPKPAGPPTNIIATGGDKKATVSFAPPTDVGGALITAYEMTATPGGHKKVGAASPITMTGLTNGTAYTFSVRAINAAGYGASGNSNKVTPAGLPGAPTGVTATAGNGLATVSFKASDSNGSPIDHYTVTAPGVTSVTGKASPIKVTGLTNGKFYWFTVKATNGAGTGPDSAESNTVQPVALPGAPTNVTAKAGDETSTGGKGQAWVSFNPPASTGGLPVQSYTAIPYSGRKLKSLMTVGPQSPIVVNNLTNGTSYTFTVVATTSEGTSPESPPSNTVTPAFRPDAPTGVTATAGNGQVTVSFGASNANGSPIDHYTVTPNPGGKSTTGKASPITVTGLTNGTPYTFTVTATNAMGTSPPSSTWPPTTPATIPGKPLNVNAVPGDKQATVTFDAPDDGGSKITSYRVTSGTIVTVGTASPTVVTGLKNGTTYSFKVQGINIMGGGPVSDPSNPVTPALTAQTSITSSQNPVNLGRPVTFTATVTGASGAGVPTGTVQFQVDGSNFKSPVTLSGGSAVSSATSSLSVGDHTVKAFYNGDTNYGASYAVLTQTVLNTSTTSVSSSLNPSTYGQPVAFTAGVSGPSGPTAPSGTVQFTVDGTNLGSPVTLSGGQAVSWTTYSLSLGNHAVAAAYSGDTSHGPSTGTLAGGQTVNQTWSRTYVTSSQDPSLYQQPVTFTAGVWGPSGPTAPSGTVQFAVDGTNLGSPVTLTGGQAVSAATSSLSVKNHAVAAAYSGDTNYGASTGTLDGGQTVQASSTTTVSSSENPSYYRQSVTFTATVAGVSGVGTPTGTVQFQVDGNNLGSPVTLSGGSAVSPATSSLTPGNHPVTAAYSGDGAYVAGSGTLSGGQVVHNN